jgi:post-GPI attachment to proteins factor 3
VIHQLSSLKHHPFQFFNSKIFCFSAFAMMLFQFNAFFIRILKMRKSRKSKLVMYSIGAFCCLYFLYHINYLSAVKFDYGYNMKVNVIFGLANSLCWLVWSFHKYFYQRQRYVWKGAAAIILVDVTIFLELTDFRPVFFWSLDAHALWHLSTVAFPFLWYDFLIDDNNFIKWLF